MSAPLLPHEPDHGRAKFLAGTRNMDTTSSPEDAFSGSAIVPLANNPKPPPTPVRDAPATLPVTQTQRIPARQTPATPEVDPGFYVGPGDPFNASKPAAFKPQ